MLYINSFIWILLFNAFLVLILNKEFEKTLILSFCSASLILYVFSFFKMLRIGYYITWIPIILFLILFVKLLLAKNKTKINEFKNNYLRPSLFVFVLLMVYFFVIFKHQGFSQCDDFMHWGPMVISSIKENGFYLNSDILKVHHDYPPIITMYRMLWVGFNNFNYEEPYLFVSQLVFYVSCLFPLYSFINGKYKVIKNIVLTICILLLGLCIPMTITAQEWALLYNSIYLDFIIVAYSAYILMFVLRFEKYKYLSLCITLSCLLLFKQIGICYYILIVFYMIVNDLINKERNLLKIFIPIIVSILFFVSWSMIVRSAQVGGQFVITEMKFTDVLTMFNNKDGYTYKIFVLFSKTLLVRRLMYNIPFFVYVILVSILLAYINRKNYLYGITYFLGSFAYALIMALLYMLAFDPVEAEVLASFDRYILSYEYFGLILLFISMVIKISKEEDKKLYLYPIFIICLLLSVEWKSFESLLPHKLDNKPNASVLIVDSVDGFVTYREEVNGLNFEFNDSKLNYENISEEEFLNEVKSNNFLYINEYNPEFYDKYWPVLKQNFDPYTKVLYEIKNDNNILTLVPLHVHYNARVLEYYIIPK